MSVKINDSDRKLNKIAIKRLQNGKDVGIKAAFAGNEKLEILITVPRALGILRVILCVEIDEKSGFEIPFSFNNINDGCDEFLLTLDFASLFPEGDGLMFWRAKLEGEFGTFYTESINNIDFRITNDNSAKMFRILVYNKDLVTPDWAKRGVMYQIFVDRFFKGNVEIPVRSDAEINKDWYCGIPEYSIHGEPIENNIHFGGTLFGVAQKLDYLIELGVDVLYLNPVFKAYSNHKYDTADYEKIDEMFGGDEAFDFLAVEMKKRNMHLILDGVFNHTGSDSKYFNKKGKYKELGAYQSKDSKYYSWYNFYEHPHKYEAWWGIDILPRINGKNNEVKEYFLSEKGIVRKWLKRGADGFRLDVADELCDEFLTLLKNAVKHEKEDSLIIGEVWENAADKISYGVRRKYFRGHQLDSVMNYPIKEAIINFAKYRDADSFYNTVTDIYSSYPDECKGVLMNLLSSHDTVRILTRLAGEGEEGKSKQELSELKLKSEQFEEGKKLLFFASALQFTLPGMPCIYYGDEIGMQGYSDPFCRRPYPWGFENKEILSQYKKLCGIKKSEKALQMPHIEFLYHKDSVVVYKRGDITVFANAGQEKKTFRISGGYIDLLCGENIENTFTTEPCSVRILKKKAVSC